MHHSKIEISRFVGIGFFENIEKIVSNCTQFEELLNLIFL